jgi:dinuclear metal center YbgI/SA1388 family protein
MLGITMLLRDLLERLESIAPLGHAEDWDNVGLLLEPPPGCEGLDVRRALLTIDLGEDVLAEASEHGAHMVISYHPPVFSGLKRLTRASAGERVVADALRAGIAVYSPHTALDAAPGGVNDWLAEALGASSAEPIEPAKDGTPGYGMGRRFALSAPATLEALVPRIKQHLGLDHVRVAASEPHARGGPIGTAAVCAGAGGSIFAPLWGPELFLTGEMRHHDVRAKVAAGASVVLCDHTNTERGYLPTLARRLAELCPDVTFSVSSRDRDPLVVS